jgi:hypothetical protein
MDARIACIYASARKHTLPFSLTLSCDFVWFLFRVKIHSFAHSKFRIQRTVFEFARNTNVAYSDKHACKPNMQASDVWCTCTHACKPTTLSVCLCPSLFVSVCLLFVKLARTCIHTHTNVRNGCTHCMHPCKCTKIYALFSSRSPFLLYLVSLSFWSLFSRMQAHIITNLCNISVCLCVWVCIEVCVCTYVCVLVCVRACVKRKSNKQRNSVYVIM